MHRDEVTVDETLVRRLLAGQFPEWGELPLELVEPRGTDNWLFRLGEELVVRLPCRERTVATLVRERTWLPRLAGLLPLEIPLPVAAGEPGSGYPWTWSVYRWLDGENAIDAPVADLAQAAVDLAALLAALQRIDPGGGPGPGEENFFRGAPLEVFDPRLRADLAHLRDEIDVEAAAGVWEAALRAPRADGSPVWVHGDLDRRNLLTRQGRLTAVVDFGCLGVGDPAVPDRLLVLGQFLDGHHLRGDDVAELMADWLNRLHLKADGREAAPHLQGVHRLGNGRVLAQPGKGYPHREVRAPFRTHG